MRVIYWHVTNNLACGDSLVRRSFPIPNPSVNLLPPAGVSNHTNCLRHAVIINEPGSVQKLPGFWTIAWLQGQHALDERHEVFLVLPTQRPGQAANFPQ